MSLLLLLLLARWTLDDRSGLKPPVASQGHFVVFLGKKRFFESAFLRLHCVFYLYNKYVEVQRSKFATDWVELRLMWPSKVGTRHAHTSYIR